MKKRTFRAVAVVAIATLISINLNLNTTGNKSGIVIANVEALANNEGTTPSIDCPGGQTLCAEVNRRGDVFKFYKQ